MTLSCGTKEAFPDVPATYALGLLSSLCNQGTKLYFATLCVLSPLLFWELQESNNCVIYL